VTTGIHCPRCGAADMHVVYTRKGYGVVRRRRKCTRCGYRTTTFERSIECRDRGEGSISVTMIASAVTELAKSVGIMRQIACQYEHERDNESKGG